MLDELLLCRLSLRERVLFRGAKGPEVDKLRPWPTSFLLRHLIACHSCGRLDFVLKAVVQANAFLFLVVTKRVTGLGDNVSRRQGRGNRSQFATVVSSRCGLDR